PVFPSSGSEFSISNKIAYLPVKSVAPNEPDNFFRNAIAFKFYNPLLSVQGTNRLVLMTLADLGQLGLLGAHPYVPATELFIMGGSGLGAQFLSVPLRGYDDGTIGVRPLSGSPYAEGGKAYARFVAEMRFMI